MHVGARHERRTDERVGARLVMIAVDQDGARPQTQQCRPRALGWQGEPWHMPRQFDGGSQERGREGIGGEDQDVVTIHVAIGVRVVMAVPVAGRTSKRAIAGPTPLDRDRYPPLTRDVR